MCTRDKKTAVLDLVNLEYFWKGWIEYNNEHNMLYYYLDQVIEDIYEGFISYDTFQDAFINISERIGRADSDLVDDCLLYVKRAIVKKYSTINYRS